MDSLFTEGEGAGLLSTIGAGAGMDSFLVTDAPGSVGPSGSLLVSSCWMFLVFSIAAPNHEKSELAGSGSLIGGAVGPALAGSFEGRGVDVSFEGRGVDVSFEGRGVDVSFEGKAVDISFERKGEDVTCLGMEGIRATLAVDEGAGTLSNAAPPDGVVSPEGNTVTEEIKM